MSLTMARVGDWVGVRERYTCRRMGVAEEQSGLRNVKRDVSDRFDRAFSP